MNNSSKHSILVATEQRRRTFPCRRRPLEEVNLRNTFLNAESCANTLLVHDEALKNLMMSWYFAGYYTGLYEGKQQATQAMTGDGSVNQKGT